MGFKNKLILDIVESKRGQKLYVSMNMYEHYRTLIHLYFPEAVKYVNSFHILNKIKNCLNLLRKRIMRHYADSKNYLKYKFLKYRYKLLLNSGDKQFKKFL